MFHAHGCRPGAERQHSSRRAGAAARAAHAAAQALWSWRVMTAGEKRLRGLRYALVATMPASEGGSAAVLQNALEPFGAHAAAIESLWWLTFWIGLLVYLPSWPRLPMRYGALREAMRPPRPISPGSTARSASLVPSYASGWPLRSCFLAGSSSPAFGPTRCSPRSPAKPRSRSS